VRSCLVDVDSDVVQWNLVLVITNSEFKHLAKSKSFTSLALDSADTPVFAFGAVHVVILPLENLGNLVEVLW